MVDQQLGHALVFSQLDHAKMGMSVIYDTRPSQTLRQLFSLKLLESGAFIEEIVYVFLDLSVAVYPRRLRA